MRIHWIDQTRVPGLQGAHLHWTGAAIRELRGAGHDVVDLEGEGAGGVDFGALVAQPCDLRIVFRGLTDRGRWAGEPGQFAHLGEIEGPILNLGYMGFHGPITPGQFWWAFGDAHARYYRDRGVSREAIRICAPPYWLEIRIRAPGPRGRVALYASSWDRGLDALLRAWPQIRRQVPEARLLVGYGREQRAGLPDGVTQLVNVGPREIGAAMEQARVLLYPDQSGAELYCFTVREALVRGCAALVTPRGALPEAVGSRVAVAQFPHPWIRRAAALLEDADGAHARLLWEESTRGRSPLQGGDLGRLVSEWEP